MEGVNMGLGKGVREVMWGKAQQDVENDQHCVCATGPWGLRGVLLQGEGGREGEAGVFGEGGSRPSRVEEGLGGRVG